jgi:hypothetical protein
MRVGGAAAPRHLADVRERRQLERLDRLGHRRLVDKLVDSLRRSTIA